MTDVELIELVETKTPQELTAAEVRALRERLPQSPALQLSLAEHLEMERYLGDCLGGVRISPEAILARAGHGRRLRRWVALSLLLGAGLAAGLTWYLVGAASRGNADGETVVVAAPSQPTHQPQSAGHLPVSPTQPDNTATSKTPPDDPRPAPVEPPRSTAPEPYALVDPRKPGLNEAQLRAWFDPVAGQPHSFKVVPARDGQAAVTEMDGLLRLRTEWKTGAALRCLFHTFKSVKFHVWHGTDGITLELWRGAGKYPTLPDLSLVAYRTTRKGKGPRPDTQVLAASDEGELWRTRTAFVASAWPRLVSTPIDLRHEDGLLTVSCGDVRILSVPFDQPPAEVYFDGNASVHALGIAPLIPLAPLRAALPGDLDVTKPSELPWLGDQDHLEKQDDGSVELRADKARRCAVATLLPARGVCEAIMQLEGVTPGTGVYLGDERGQMQYLASFVKDEATARTLVMEGKPADTAVALRFDATRWPPAYVADKVWLRLLVACGELKCWVSSDGVHWGRAFDSAVGWHAQPSLSFGLYCQPGEPPRSLRLRRLVFRELPALNALAPAQLVRQAPVVASALLPHTSLGEWLATVHAVRPQDVDPAVWSRACALRALASGVSPSLGRVLLENLLDQGLQQPADFDAQVRLIDEALLLTPKYHTPQSQHFVNYYERLGQALRRSGEARPYSRLRQALYHNPFWSNHVLDVFPESLATAELLDLAAAGKWEEVDALAQVGRMHRLAPSVFDWARIQASRRENQKPLPWPPRWQPALVLDLDKNGTSELAEIDAALVGNSVREACRSLTRLTGRADHGLLPDRSDSQRLLSWPVALTELFQAHAELRPLLRDDFAAEGKLQLRRALDERDEVALEALALRYFATEQAAEALIWLGDRHLVDGEPALAVGYYRRAQRMTERALGPRIEGRLQLTAALLGQPGAAAPAADLEFGDLRLTPPAWEALRKKRSDEGVDSRWTASLPPQLAPAPTAFDLVPRGRFEGETGDKPEVVSFATYPHVRPDIDWFARHAGLAVDGNRLFVSNRFQVDCYEMPAGRLLWRTGLSREASRQEMPAGAYTYPLTPMRPVVAGPRLFVRRLMRGPLKPVPVPAVATLACLEAATGKVLWSTSNHVSGRVHYVSDPVVIQDQVFVVGQKQSADGESTLTLMVHNRADGALLAERHLAPLRGSFDDHSGCQLTPLPDSCLATVGGGILCFELTGTLRWARRPLWIPPEADPQWIQQGREPPLVAGERCFVVQPGVLNLVCLDPETGRVHWQRAIPGLRRIAGLAGGRLILHTNRGFTCLEEATGKELWQHVALQVLSLSSLCSAANGLMYGTTEAVIGEKDLYRPALVWVDLETGREKSRTAVDTLRHAQPRLGPVFVAGERVWAFSGTGNSLARDLVELVPTARSLLAGPAATEWEAWRRKVPRALRTAVAQVLPDWTVFDGEPHARTGLVGEYQGKRDVVCAAPGFIVARHVAVPNTAKPRLALEAASDPKGQCTLVVEIDGKRLEQTFAGDQWKKWELDLSDYKGKRPWVLVRHLPRGTDTACSYLAKIELLE
jgi:outer membrane protein assembly factor BamB